MSVVTATKTTNLPRLLATRNFPDAAKLKVYIATTRRPDYGVWYYDQWQRQDMAFVIDNQIAEVMLLRNRGGSKTRDGANLAVYFAYQRNQHGDWNRVLWYAASESQLEQAKEYFDQNRYVSHTTSSYIQLWNGNRIKFRVMTMKQSASPRSDIIFFDEEQAMAKPIFSNALGTLIGAGKGSKMIHMGTTETDSQLHDNFSRLDPLGLVLEHHVDEMSWDTEERILRENYAGQPQWVINSQLYCKWEHPGGAVFENVEVRTLRQDEIEILSMEEYFGVDPNPKSGHTLVKVRYVGPTTIYVEYEWPPYKNPFEFSRLIQSLTKDYTTFEIEENAGEEFLKVFDEVVGDDFLGDIGIKRWNQTNKFNRIISIRKMNIIINPVCKETIKHVRGAVWDKKEPQGKLLKTPEQHYLDSFLHASLRGDEISVGVA